MASELYCTQAIINAALATKTGSLLFAVPQPLFSGFFFFSRLHKLLSYDTKHVNSIQPIGKIKPANAAAAANIDWRQLTL